MDRVFISYRRADAEPEAKLIAQCLRDEIGKDEVFLDTNDIASGQRWRERIDAALQAAQVVLVVIGKRWLDTADAQGMRRLGAEGDIVTHEISRALQRGILVIPVRVQEAPIPAAEQLPAALKGLFDFNDCEVRSGAAHARDVQALIDAVTGRRRGRRRWLGRPGIAAAVAAVAVAAVGLAALTFGAADGPPLVTKLQPPLALPAQRPQALLLQLQLGASADPDVAPPMKLWHRAPSAGSTPNINLLERPQQVGSGLLEYSSPLPLMPQVQQQYHGLMHRLVASSTHATAQTDLCFVATDKPRRDEPLVRLDCKEGQRCSVSVQDGGWAQDCPQGERTTQRPAGWSLWGLAHAAEPPPPRPWAVPSLQTLRAATGSAGAGAWSEVHLHGAVPAARGADRLIWAVRINGNPLWVDGLPAEATALAFDAERGLDLRFGLENLDASGRDEGFEDLRVDLQFMAGDRRVLHEKLQLRYVALRPIDARDVQTEGGLALRWSAAYRHGAGDGWQVILESPSTGAGLADRKRRIDAAGEKIEVGGQVLPLVAVQRPPWTGNPNHALNAGLLQPSGQIKFSFDDASARSVCKALVRIAARKPGLLRSDTYRRALDGSASVNRCASFSAA